MITEGAKGYTDDSNADSGLEETPTVPSDPFESFKQNPNYLTQVDGKSVLTPQGEMELRGLVVTAIEGILGENASSQVRFEEELRRLGNSVIRGPYISHISGLYEENQNANSLSFENKYTLLLRKLYNLFEADNRPSIMVNEAIGKMKQLRNGEDLIDAIQAHIKEDRSQTLDKFEDTKKRAFREVEGRFNHLNQEDNLDYSNVSHAETFRDILLVLYGEDGNPKDLKDNLTDLWTSLTGKALLPRDLSGNEFYKIADRFLFLLKTGKQVTLADLRDHLFQSKIWPSIKARQGKPVDKLSLEERV